MAWTKLNYEKSTEYAGSCTCTYGLPNHVCSFVQFYVITEFANWCDRKDETDVKWTGQTLNVDVNQLNVSSSLLQRLSGRILFVGLSNRF